MRRKITFLSVVMLAGLLLVLSVACGDVATVGTVTPEIGDTSATPSASKTVKPEATSPPAEEEPASGEEEEAKPTPTGVLDDVILTRTPEPTATPGMVDQGVTELAARAGLTGTTFLGLPVTDWINLGVSLLLVLIGYLLGTWLIRRILPWVVRRTATEFDDRLLKAVGSDIRWLVVLLILNIATTRLTFFSVGLKVSLADTYFVLGLAIAMRIVWQLVTLTGKWLRERAAQDKREEQLDPIITLLVRMGRATVIVVGLSILLNHFGVNVTAFAAALGVGGLAISLAARDTLADVIAGLAILLDQPFRVGDRIEISGLGTWGDVIEIGSRTTRIRTRDNRMVIVPNSTIGKSQVINYTYPDPRYRVEMDIGIGYGMDIEKTRQIIVDTVRRIEGVLPDKPVEALYNEMGDSAMLFRVRWWIESYADTRLMFDRVNTALQKVLDEAGIDMPYPTQSLILQVDPGTIKQLYLSRQEPDSVRDRPAARSVPNEGEAEQQDEEE